MRSPSQGLDSTVVGRNVDLIENSSSLVQLGKYKLHTVVLLYSFSVLYFFTLLYMYELIMFKYVCSMCITCIPLSTEVQRGYLWLVTYTWPCLMFVPLVGFHCAIFCKGLQKICIIQKGHSCQRLQETMEHEKKRALNL